MQYATFYFLQNNTLINGLIFQEALVCNLIKEHWRKNKKVLVLCQNKKQAIRLDKALWQYPVNAFIPHNLVGEGLKFKGTPVELAWQHYYSDISRDLLITLLPNFIDLATTFDEVIDFIPYEESLKELARKRYQAYRNVGFILNTIKSYFLRYNKNE